jgi:hypothetical protein
LYNDVAIAKKDSSSVVSRIFLTIMVSADPLTRLATLATLSPKRAQEGEGIVKSYAGQDRTLDGAWGSSAC